MMTVWTKFILKHFRRAASL